jgi:hypothetical protein
MWKWFKCYLSGHHEFGVWCEPGTIFLRCVHCGRRSSGWALEQQEREALPPTPARTPQPQPSAMSALRSMGRVVPFARTALR